MMYQEFAFIYDKLMEDVDYYNWSNYLESIFKKNNIKANALILDCACGTGNITAELAKKGYDLIGIDSSEYMLNIASEKARQNGQNIMFLLQDISAFEIGKKVDVVNCTCDGVNYLSDKKQAISFFKCAKNSLKPKGIFCFDISSYYKISEILADETIAQSNDNEAFIWENFFDNENSIITMELTTFHKDKGNIFKRFQEVHIQKAYKQKELEDMLKVAGFQNIACYDAQSFNVPSVYSERLQFVAL